MNLSKKRVMRVFAIASLGLGLGFVSITPAYAGVFERIAMCESKGQQFSPSGRALKNPNSSAIGVYQILAKTHARHARKMGFNILTRAGNIGYARHLFRTEGTKPWLASRHCWGKGTRVASR